MPTSEEIQRTAALAAVLRVIIAEHHAATLSKRGADGPLRPHAIEPYQLDGAAPTSILTYWRHGVGVERATLQTIAEVVDLGRPFDALTDALPLDTTLYSTREAAQALGLSEQRVRALAASRGVGQRIGERSLAFTRADIEAMRVRTPGRPRSSRDDE